MNYIKLYQSIGIIYENKSGKQMDLCISSFLCHMYFKSHILISPSIIFSLLKTLKNI